MKLRQRYTRERYAFFALLSTLSLVILGVTTVIHSSPWMAINKVLSNYFGYPFEETPTHWAEKALIFFFVGFIISTITRSFKNWDGKKSIKHYQQEKLHEEKTWFLDALEEISRILGIKPKLEIYNPEEKERKQSSKPIELSGMGEQASNHMILTEEEREYFLTGIATYILINDLKNQILPEQFEAIVRKLYNLTPETLDISNKGLSNKDSYLSIKERLQNIQNPTETIKTDIETCGMLIRDVNHPGALKFPHQSLLEHLFVKLAAHHILNDKKSNKRAMYDAILAANRANRKKIIKISKSIPSVNELLNLQDSNEQPKPLKLRKMIFRSIKCFEQGEITFQEKSTLIVGTNGRGKTTLLQLLALGLTGLKTPPLETDWSGVVRAGEEEGRFELEVKWEDKISKLTYSIDTHDNVQCIENPDKVPIHELENLIVAYGPSRNLERRDTKKNEQFSPVASLFGVNTYLKDIRLSQTYNYVEPGFEELKKIINTLFELADPSQPVQLHHFDADSFYFQVPTVENDSTIPLEAMSAGFRSLFVWVFDLVLRAWEKEVDLDEPETLYGLVLIDELDTHLHPSWQRKLLPALETLFPNLQFVVTSHSPFVIQSMQSDQIFSLVVKNKTATIKKLDLTGPPHGFQLEEILKEVTSLEAAVPINSAWLSDHLKKFRDAIQKVDEEKVAQLYNQIKENIPESSKLHAYLDIMSAGLRGEEDI